jgi:hypothetical protein
VRGPLLELVQTHIEARRNAGSLVEAAEQIDHNLATSVVIDDFKFANVT